MFQKCPVCNGTGVDPGVYSLNKCSVCQGMKIISELNGLPPSSSPATHSISNTTNYRGTDFRDDPMESQDEYFGKK